MHVATLVFLNKKKLEVNCDCVKPDLLEDVEARDEIVGDYSLPGIITQCQGLSLDDSLKGRLLNIIMNLIF